jgi:hypothetical protein
LKRKISQQFSKFKTHPKKRHFVLGLSTFGFLCLVLILFVSTKSRKLSAEATEEIVVEAPNGVNGRAEVIGLTAFAVAAASDLPESDILGSDLFTAPPEAENPAALPDDGDLGITKNPSVRLTRELSRFSNELSKFLAANRVHATITSGVRTGNTQLDIIKDRIAERGMMSAFPGLETATLADTNDWIVAWEWLKSRRVPVNPPADYVNDDGKTVGGSLHLKGLAIDLVGNDLDQLKAVLTKFAESSSNGVSGLRVTGVVRESDCVHISLSR